MIRDLFIFFEIVRCVLGKFNYNFLKIDFCKIVNIFSRIEIKINYFEIISV